LPESPTTSNSEVPAEAGQESIEDQPVADATSGAAIGDTAGTGTIVALGCITGTIFLIVLGVIYLLITQLLG